MSKFRFKDFNKGIGTIESIQHLQKSNNTELARKRDRKENANSAMNESFLSIKKLQIILVNKFLIFCKKKLIPP